MANRTIELGTISSRGQIAIPSKIRSELELVEGEKVLFILEGNTLIIKKISNDKSFNEITKSLRESAKKSDLREDEVVDIIHRYRKQKKE